MNRAERRARQRNARRGGLDLHPVDLDAMQDGYPCPYCRQVTAPDEHEVWRCLCGWSGELLALPA